MAWVFIHMEKIIKHFRLNPRTFRNHLKVSKAGIVNAKNYQINRHFSEIGFSFVLYGSGVIYHWRGEAQILKPPCVYMQMPDERMTYGPLSGETYDELFFTYDLEQADYLKWKNYYQTNPPWWRINNFAEVSLAADRLREIILTSRDTDLADQADLICENMLAESILSTHHDTSSKELQLVKALCEEMRDCDYGFIDLDDFARSHDISSPTLRRYWQKYMGMSPGQYRSRQLIRRACGLLTGTDMPIGEIAEQLNFSDQLYFSKKFSKVLGMCPSEYRKRYENKLER